MILSLLSSGKDVDLVAAKEVAKRDLVIEHDSMTSVMDADPIPAIRPDLIKAYLNELLNCVEEDIEEAKEAVA